MWSQPSGSEPWPASRRLHGSPRSRGAQGRTSAVDGTPGAASLPTPPAPPYRGHPVATRLAYLLLVVALLLGRVTCGWGVGADPCCGEAHGKHGQVMAVHADTPDAGDEDALDHALHAGHCHCLWTEAKIVALAVPAEQPARWTLTDDDPPPIAPRGIEWPPRHAS